MESLGGDVTGVAAADLTGDGRTDLVLNTHADGVRILVNDGQGSFRVRPFPQVAARGGIRSRWPTWMAMAGSTCMSAIIVRRP